MTARQFWSFGLLVATTLVAASGCRETTPGELSAGGNVREAAYQDLDPKSLLQAVFHRYRSADTYRDAGRVGLAYERAGRREHQWAPLSVSLDRGRFYVEAYSLRCYCDSQQTLAWIDDPATDGFDRQVSVSPPPESRRDWEKLTLDPIFAEHLSAGLGGPPPQLDWLFAAEPMKGLFNDPQRFEFGEERLIDQRPCQSVIVHADSQRYTFWIDRSEAIVRQIELPSVIAPPAPGEPPQTMTLTVELHEASFGPWSTAPAVQPLPERPQYVKQFVPLPPQQPNRALGHPLSPKLARPLTLKRSASGVPFNAVSIVILDPDTHASLAMAGWLGGWRDRLPRELSEQICLVRVGPATEAIDSERWVTIAADPKTWAESLGIAGAGLAIVSAEHSLMWSHASLYPHELPLLGTIVVDVLAGVDVPQRLRDDWQVAHDAYRSELKRRYQAPK